LGGLAVTVGEKLSYPEERICTGTARDFAHQPFAPLSVLLAEAMEVPCRAPGLPDDAFIRGDVPMTKQEVRAAILAKLAVRPSDVCWDVGAGTGSVSVELALQGGEVWATERKPEACQLIRQNRERFQALNLHVVEGCAPEGLDNLPKPDAVFVGGSGGNLEGILRAVHQANPQARLCVSAIALETLEEARRIMAALSYETEITQIAVSRTKAAGGLHLLMAQNPVFLISGVSQCED
jgi:precorrin-6Y C5,15-methyltransferase (decarboxylating)